MIRIPPLGNALAVTALLLPLLISALAQAALPEAGPFAEVDRRVEAAMTNARVPGAVVAIVEDGDLVHARGFGQAREAVPAHAETPFLIASITKTFTAFMILQLVEEGRLTLDTPVQAVLPEFEVGTPGASNRITIRHLLTHTSGLPSITPGEYDRLLTPATSGDLSREVAHLRGVALESEPGERFQYSNAGYVVLAGIIEEARGEPYEVALSKHVFTPLGMPHAHGARARALDDGLATGHRYVFGRPFPFSWSPSRAAIGAGFTYASARDLATYASFLLNASDARSGHALNASSIRAMHEPAIPIPGSFNVTQAYGLGWFIGSLHGHRIVHHAGVAPGFHADLILIPDKRLAIVYLVNANDPLRPASFDQTAFTIASVLLGETPHELPRSMGVLLLARNTILIGTVALAALAATALAITWRTRNRRARFLLGVLPPGLLGLPWALICLMVVPGLLRWPLRGLTLEVPELGWLLFTGGGLAIAWCVTGPLVTVLAARRARPRARR